MNATINPYAYLVAASNVDAVFKSVGVGERLCEFGSSSIRWFEDRSVFEFGGEGNVAGAGRERGAETGRRAQAF